MRWLMHRNTACALLQVLAVQERKPARLPRPFAALLSAPAGSAALAAATYAATGAAAMALLGRAQHAGGAAVAPDYSRLAGFGAAAGLTFVAWALAAGWNVLDFPAQRNSRALRLRECLTTGVRPNTKSGQRPQSQALPAKPFCICLTAVVPGKRCHPPIILLL